MEQKFLTNEQIFSLNEKHGWFEFGDAQSDVSRAFAHDAIAMHERIRQAAPDLLAALQEMVADFGPMSSDKIRSLGPARAAIAKATGAA